MEQQLLAILDNENSRKQYRYLLLDALTTVSEMDYIALNSIKDILGSNAITTIERPDLSHDLDSCPKLIKLADPGNNIDNRLIHFSALEALEQFQASKKYICGWMVSKYPPELIAEQMVNIGQALMNQIGIKFVPFYEPVRMQLFVEGNSVCSEWLADILSCFDCYCFPTLKGELSIIHNLGYHPERYNLFITEETKFYQQETSAIFQLYCAQYEINYQKRPETARDINLISIATIYRKAWQIGLHNIHDRFVFCLMSLRYGDLTSNAELKLAIEVAKDDSGSLSERFQQIDREVFLSISRNIASRNSEG